MQTKIFRLSAERLRQCVYPVWVTLQLLWVSNYEKRKNEHRRSVFVFLFSVSLFQDLPSLGRSLIMKLRIKPENLPKILLLTFKWSTNLTCFISSRYSILNLFEE